MPYLDAVTMHLEAKVDALVEGLLGGARGVDVHYLLGGEVALLVVDDSVNDTIPDGLGR